MAIYIINALKMITCRHPYVVCVVCFACCWAPPGASCRLRTEMKLPLPLPLPLPTTSRPSSFPTATGCVPLRSGTVELRSSPLSGSCCLVVVMFSMCIVFSIGSECGPAEYKTGAGECCPMCGKGSVVHRHCTSDSSTTCIPCIRGTYMDEPNGLTKCFPCNTCDPGQGLIFLNECTTTSNAVCDAKDGFYCKSYSKNKECSYAIKHSTCSPGEYLKVPGTKTADTQCEQCPHGYFSTSGVSCTAWTKCNFDQQKTAEGTKTNNTVCENIPERSRLWILGPVLLTAVLCAGLTGNYFKEGRKNQSKTPIQETCLSESPEQRQLPEGSQIAVGQSFLL